MSDQALPPRNTPSVARLASVVFGIAAITASVVAVSGGVPQAAIRALPGEPPVVKPLSAAAAAPDRTVVCQGPFLGFVQQETTPRGFGEPAVSVMGAEAVATDFTGEPLLDVFAGTEQKTAQVPQFFAQPASAGFLGGVSLQNIDTPFVRGLQASTCDEPASELWLVAGSTTTGRQGVVTLSNPGSVQATVDLELFGESGPIAAPSARGILLQPGERRVFALSGLTPDETSPVIRVVSAGTPVAAALHLSLTRGLQPDGADVVSPQLPPSTVRVLPGVWLESEDQLSLVSGVEGYDDIEPVLRLLSPESNASVDVVVTRPVTGEVTNTVRLEAGKVFDVALAGLGQGNASVTVRSDQPVVAGLRHSAVSEGQTDLAWMGSAPIIEGLGSVVVPAGVEAVLQVASVGEEAVGVSFARVQNDGATAISQGRVEVDAGALSTRVLGTGGGNYVFESNGPVAIGVLLLGPGQIANLFASPPPAEVPEVSVYTR